MPKKLLRETEKANLFAERYGGKFYFKSTVNPKKILKAFEKQVGLALDFTSRVHTPVEMENVLKLFPPIDPFSLKAGDTVFMFVTRRDYLRTNNKNHGWVIVRANITDDGWEKQAIPWESDVKRWEEPIGKERNRQDVDHCYPFPRYSYILYKLGQVTYVNFPMKFKQKSRVKHGKS